MRNVSVVIPAHNAREFLGKAVRSVLEQTHRCAEIIIVDDGSTDGTVGVASSFGEQVKYIRQENAGAAIARNSGIHAATSEYIAFLDADDFWFPDKTQRQLQRFDSDPEIALVYCAKERVDGDGLPAPLADEPNSFPSGWIFTELFRANYISTASEVIVRKDALLDVGLFSTDPRLRNCQDYELWLRIAARYKIGVVPDKLVYYRRHAANATLNPVKRFIGMQAALESAIGLGVLPPDSPLVKERLFSLCDSFGGTLFHAGHYAWARRAYLRALRLNPKGLRTNALLRLGLTYLPASWVDAMRARRRDLMHD